MKLLLKKIEIFQFIDKQFYSKQVKSLEQLYSKLDISERQLYRYLKFMDDIGASVGFNFKTGRYEYLGNKRMIVRINTDPSVKMNPAFYNKITDRTLKKIKFFNSIDKFIYSKQAGSTEQFEKKLKFKDSRNFYAIMKDFKSMGASYYYDYDKRMYLYPKGKCFNFLIELEPVKSKKGK